MKDYSNPYKRKFAFLVTMKNSDSQYESPTTHIVVAHNIGKAAQMAYKFAMGSKNGLYVVSIQNTEATEHVIL